MSPRHQSHFSKRFLSISGLFFFGILLMMPMSCSEPTKCRSDKECSRDEICSNRICKARTPCTSSNARDVCASNEKCINRFCKPNSTSKPSDSCNDHIDCNNFQFCHPEKRKCVECLSNSDCGVDKTCVDSVCATGNGDGGPLPEQSTPSENAAGCTTDKDCPANHTCNTTTKRCQSLGCKADGECPGGQYCVSGNCTTGRRDCSANPSVCHVGFVCKQGLCYRSFCQSDQDCPQGETCDRLKGSCGKNVPKNCTTLGCPTGQTCNKTTGQCEGTATKCQADSDCLPPNGTCAQQKCQSCKVTGCPSGKSCDANSGQCGTKAASCKSDSDCQIPSGSCQNGQCRSCATHFSCNSPSKCNISTGRCVIPPCTSDGDCPAPKGICRNKQCQSCSTLGCTGKQICNARTGRCENPPPPCTSNGQCRYPNGTCHNGKCQSCAAHFTCPKGQVCTASTGRCVPKPCTSNNDCAPPNGWCRFSRCYSCKTIACPSTQICEASTGRCLTPKKCTTNSQCPSDSFCRLGICLKKGCDPVKGIKCPTGQTCQNFECLQNTLAGRCNTNSACGSSEYCHTGSCVKRECDPATPCSNGSICLNYKCVKFYQRCVYNCSANQTCLMDSKSVRTCHSSCSVVGSTCKNGGKCTSVTFPDGKTIRVCFPKGGTIAVGSTCKPNIYPNPCVTGAVCLGTSPTSTSGKCVKTCTPGSSSGCRSTEECAEQAPGKGLCLPKGTRTSSTCYRTTTRCTNQYECLPSYATSSSGRCYKRCTPGSTNGCLSTEDCVALPNSNSYGACLRKSTRSEGSTCEATPYSRCKPGFTCVPTRPHYASNPYSGYCRRFCKTDSDCTHSSYKRCSGGFCMPRGTAREGSSCYLSTSLSTRTCTTGLTCVPSSPTSTSGYCRKRCTTSSQCASLYPECSQGYCRKKGTRTEGATCSLTSSYSRCKTGLTCLRSTSFSHYCYKPCTSDSNCSGTRPECASGFCQKKGTLGEGTYCTSSTNRCQKIFDCVKPKSYLTIRCLKPCTSNTQCTGRYKKCVATANGDKHCYL